MTTTEVNHGDPAWLGEIDDNDPYALNGLYATTLGHINAYDPVNRDGFAFLYLRYAITHFTPVQVHVMGAALASVVAGE